VATSPKVIEAVERILTERGPLSKEALESFLQEQGVSTSGVQWDLIETACPVSQLVDDRYVWLPDLLRGRVFTHRVTADEALLDMLVVQPDLSAITVLTEYSEFDRFADGSPVVEALPEFDGELLDERGITPEILGEHTALILEPGTLAGLGAAAGDTVGLGLSPDGLVLRKVDTTGPDAVGEKLAAAIESDTPIVVSTAVWTLCAADSDLFTEPAPPLAEILTGQGLPFRGDFVAPGGFDFDRWHLERNTALLVEYYGVDPADAHVLTALFDLGERLSRLLGQNDPYNAINTEFSKTVDTFGSLGDLGTVLADPMLAQIFVAETIDADVSSAGAVNLIATVLEENVSRKAKAACRWLRGTVRERIGDIDEAEQEFRSAEELDPDWPLTLIDLAAIASDRGDAERGLNLLRRANAPQDHPLLQLLQGHRSAPRSDVGRNEPCWCGSGRKYKKCHLGKEELSLPERAAWLYGKAAHYAQTGPWRKHLIEIASERFGYEYDPDEVWHLGVTDPLVVDALLQEGGVFSVYFRSRGSLLPDDEHDLAEEWLDVERSVFEVVEVDRGVSTTIRDLRAGDVLEVRDRPAGPRLKPGQFICGRPLPDGESMQFFGGIEVVDAPRCDALIELLNSGPAPVDLVAFLSDWDPRTLLS